MSDVDTNTTDTAKPPSSSSPPQNSDSPPNPETSSSTSSASSSTSTSSSSTAPPPVPTLPSSPKETLENALQGMRVNRTVTNFEVLQEHISPNLILTFLV
jgi:hypothetical protein